MLHLLLLLLLPATANAHPGDWRIRGKSGEFVEATIDDWMIWDFHESIVIGIVALATLYTLGITVWRKKYNLSPKMEPWRHALFYFTCVLLWFTLDGPMHHLADELLFTAHMVQHLSLQVIWAPFLIIATPDWLLSPIARIPWVNKVAKVILRPRNAWGQFTVLLIFWHLPFAYQLALEVHAWHIVEHLLFMVSAVIFWFPILGRVKEVPGPSPGWQAVYLMLAMLPMKGLGLVLSMQNDILYPFYETAPRVFGLTPIGDQRTGGLIMWLPGGLFLWVGVFFAFYKMNKRRLKRGETGLEPTPPRIGELNKSPVGELN